MDVRFICILFFTNFSFLVAQTTISGKVISSENELLSGASVYFNNTTVGTISDNKGEFQLTIKDGNYSLIISYLGYKTKQIPINTNKIQDFLTIALEEENNLLDEVDVSKTIYDDNWKYNLSRFKLALFGRSKLAQECKISNEKDLRFNYDFKTKTLTAYAKRPLQIKHYGLGYAINYDLVDFTIQDNRLYFSGYVRYKNLRKRVKNKWEENRVTAYNGSQMHFFRSLMQKKLKEDGFVVNQFKRIANPERPSEKQIQKAREIIRLSGGRINFSKEITTLTNALDSATLVIRKSRLPKFKDIFYKQNVPYEEMISIEKSIPILDFENYLMVIYTKEPEEENYANRMFGRRRKLNQVQTSEITLINGKSELDSSGITIAPNALINDGYWGFESFATMLPLDYQPKK